MWAHLTSLCPRQEYSAMKAVAAAAYGLTLGSRTAPTTDKGRLASSPRGSADVQYQCHGMTPHSLLLHSGGVLGMMPIFGSQEHCYDGTYVGQRVPVPESGKQMRREQGEDSHDATA